MKFLEKVKTFGYKNSPTILVGVGVVGVVASAVMACKATTKISEIGKKTKEQLDAVKEGLETKQEEYSKDDATKDKVIIYTHAVVDYVKLYAPSVILGGLSIACIITSNRILQKRNAVLTAAYSSLLGTFKTYRQRVKDKYGADEDISLMYGTTIEKFKDKETKEVSNVHKLNTLESGDFSRFFDAANPNWEKSAQLNVNFLKMQQEYANNKLRAKGRLYLNDVYKMLGFDETPLGQIVGWIYAPEDKTRDSYVDFGMYDSSKERVRAFINGYENVILLDFNVDGLIIDLV